MDSAPAAAGAGRTAHTVALRIEPVRGTVARTIHMERQYAWVLADLMEAGQQAVVDGRARRLVPAAEEVRGHSSVGAS